jgi:uncharacterized zinc-type alcohol dehydrogenase-like protein
MTTETIPATIALTTPAWAATSATAALAPFTIERRAPEAGEVRMSVAFCGVCHSDLHQVRNEWGNAAFPMVPGHEIVGHITEVGAGVTAWKVGDRVGVGCLVDSCRTCEACGVGEEQFCSGGSVGTYNATDKQGRPTYGGYSTALTVSQDFLLRIPANLPLDKAAPLLCAGITTYSPLRHFGVKAGDQIAVVGLGGLGHMGVKLAKAVGAHVTVLSHSPSKQDDALKLGADAFVVTSDAAAFEALAGRFSFILDTVSAAHDVNAYLALLKFNGTMCLVGAPPEPTPIHAFGLIFGRKRLVGSLIGGIKETQEMLDFCAEHDIVSDIELIPAQQINEAYERLLKGDVRYRFVIDCATITG